jgi:hypothetical protein
MGQTGQANCLRITQGGEGLNLKFNVALATGPSAQGQTKQEFLEKSRSYAIMTNLIYFRALVRKWSHHSVPISKLRVAYFSFKIILVDKFYFKLQVSMYVCTS